VQFDTSSKVELVTAAVMFVGLCQIIYLTVRDERADAKERVAPPVRIGYFQRVRTALNPGKLHRASWRVSQATVQQVYLIPHHSFKTLVSYPSIGMRTRHPFKTQTRYSSGVSYCYLVDGKMHWNQCNLLLREMYWNEQRKFVRYGSREEAQQQAEAWSNKTVMIRYDPEYPEDSQLVQ
jgi:hypothetical protein